MDTQSATDVARTGWGEDKDLWFGQQYLSPCHSAVGLVLH